MHKGGCKEPAHRQGRVQMRHQGLWGSVAITLLAAIVLTAGGFSVLAGTSAAAKAPAAPESVAAPEAKSGFGRLKGRWQRPDGGYVIDIKEVEANGKMAAAYFNPRPINVSQAQTALEGKTIKVFIELRDVNYPGATYNLQYDPQSDQLRGVYFQPALQQSFDVFFVRMK